MGPWSNPPLRADAPLLDAYLRFGEEPVTPFSVPGHKGRAGRLDAGLGKATAGDVPLYGGVDTIKLSGGVLTRAERMAAEGYGADWCRFSTGGSTHANQALCLALGQPGDQVIVSRSLHRSMLLGLILAGLEPCWLPTRIDRRCGLPLGASVADVEEALRAHPAARAVVLTEPGYLGTLGELGGVVEAAHQRDVPVIADQAWGAHFGYHPDVPRHALSLGADAMVTSVHKLLPGYSQASLACARTIRLDRGRLERGFDATHTTSPAGAILASIDGSRALMAARGPELLARVIALVEGARMRLQTEVAGLVVVDPAWFPPGQFDPTRLVLLLPALGVDGIGIEQALIARGLPVELADRDTLVPVVTVADDTTTVDLLVSTLVELLRAAPRRPRSMSAAVSWRVAPRVVMSPRQAFFAAHETVTASEAVGRVAAELIAPYPPGVPVLAPGELVSADLLAGLQAAAAEGVRIAYAADPTLATLQVVREPVAQPANTAATPD